MKTRMKLFTYGLLILTLVFTSCSKDGEDGAIGPQGADGIDGIDGIDGADGEDGEDGNEDVRLLEFEAATFTSFISYPVEGVSLDNTNEYLILGFYANITQTPNVGNSFVTKKEWIPVPGRGHLPIFETRGIVETSSANLTANTPNTEFKVSLYQYNSLLPYTTEVTFDGFKIFVIPSNLVIVPTSDPVFTQKTSNNDFSKMSYSELVAHFNLEE